MFNQWLPLWLMVKNPSAMQETQVQSLGQQDLLEKEMASHSNMLAWEIPWTKEPGGLQFMGSQKSQTKLRNNMLNNNKKMPMRFLPNQISY